MCQLLYCVLNCIIPLPLVGEGSEWCMRWWSLLYSWTTHDMAQQTGTSPPATSWPRGSSESRYPTWPMWAASVPDRIWMEEWKVCFLCCYPRIITLTPINSSVRAKLRACEPGYDITTSFFIRVLYKGFKGTTNDYELGFLQSSLLVKVGHSFSLSTHY